MKKQLLSSIASISIIMNTIGFNYIANAADTTTAPEVLVYRTSVNTTSSSNWDFSAAMKCYDNGHIHIDIQCEGYASGYTAIKNIGTVCINDSMIAEISTQGYAGTSSFNANGFSASGYTLNYTEDKIVYDLIYTNDGPSLLGKTLMKLDLYVKEDYLNMNQIITVFDKEIEIPFGEPYVNPYDTIKALSDENATLKQKVVDLQNNTGFGDIDGNDIIDGRDATMLLTYYAKTSTGYTDTLAEFIAASEDAVATSSNDTTE